MIRRNKSRLGAITLLLTLASLLTQGCSGATIGVETPTESGFEAQTVSSTPLPSASAITSQSPSASTITPMATETPSEPTTAQEPTRRPHPTPFCEITSDVFNVQTVAFEVLDAGGSYRLVVSNSSGENYVLGEDLETRGSHVYWSHGGENVAFVVDQPGKRSLVVLDTSTMLSERIDLLETLPLDELDEANYIIDIFPNSWAYDDQWLSILAVPPSTPSELRYGFANVVTGETFWLENGLYFQDWSRQTPNRYLLTESAIQQDESTTLYFSHLNSSEIIAVEFDFARGLRPGKARWSPNGQFVLMPDGHNRGRHILIDLETDEWIETGAASDLQVLSWSPSGRWVALLGDQLAFFDVTAPEVAPRILETPAESINPLTWSENADYFVFLTDDTLVTVNPEDLETKITLQELPGERETFFVDAWVKMNVVCAEDLR